jgi:hypothetical protein
MANGKIAAPLAPNAAAKPIALTCRARGRRRVATTTAPGNIGPRKKPWKETATTEA